jgi:hypothetical protein
MCDGKQVAPHRASTSNASPHRACIRGRAGRKHEGGAHMLGTFRARRYAAVTCLVATAGIGTGLGAQPRVGASGTNAPTLLSDCDIAVQSCGIPGGELYGGGATGNGGASGGGLPCGAGLRALCREQTFETCASWIVTDAGGSVSVTATKLGAGVNRSETCAQYVTNTLYYYIYS